VPPKWKCFASTGKALSLPFATISKYALSCLR
jgi:hypothetical protein